MSETGRASVRDSRVDLLSSKSEWLLEQMRMLFDATLDACLIQVVVRTTNKKWFARISIPGVCVCVCVCVP